MDGFDEEQLDDIDFAFVVFREDNVWQMEELEDESLADSASLAAELRRWPGDFGSLGLVSVDEDFFVLARVAGTREQWLLSDITAATEWTLARSVVDRLGIEPPVEEDDDPVPAGDPGLLADLGVPAMEMAALLDDEELYPDEILGRLAARLGFGALYDEALGATTA